jgi:hypothetical protein
MTAVAAKTQDLAASPTRREVVWTVAAALAGLGVVVNAAAPRAAVSPVIAAAMSISWVETWAVLVAVAATLGPIVGALVVGGKQALIVTQLRGTPLSSYLVGADQLGTSTGLLVAAALAVIGVGVAASLGGRHRATPAATGQTGPVGKGS